ncbi:Uncharacterised protein [Vibrio cholerae]|nr:Uncharacterised protein [Vibrio cholerae]
MTTLIILALLSAFIAKETRPITLNRRSTLGASYGVWRSTSFSLRMPCATSSPLSLVWYCN